LLLYPTFPLLLSTLGSETLLYLALCLGTFAFYARKRYNLTSLVAALAVLTRADGILVAGVLAADYLLRVRGPIPRLALLIFLAPAAAWFIFAWLYFGSPLPVTLAVKQHQGAMSISQRFAPGLLTIVQEWGYANRWEYWLEAFLALLGLVFAARWARSWLLFLVWPVLYFSAYSVLGVSRYFWYYAPLVPGVIAAVGLGLTAIHRASSAIHYSPSSVRHVLSAINHLGRATPFVVLLLLTLTQGRSLWQMRQHPDNRLEVYRAAGEWLQSDTSAGAWVGTLEVGIIGYYARRPMVDFAGLIQPAVAEQLTTQSTYEDSARWAIATYRPEYLVLNPVWFPNLLQEQILPNCRVLQTLQGAPHGYPGELLAYQCHWQRGNVLEVLTTRTNEALASVFVSD
jgi:hypothetical protein